MGMVKNNRLIFLVALVAGFLLFGCGGGGGSEVSSAVGDVSVPPRILNWAPPLSYSDSSPLNPATDLDFFEIYVKPNGNFMGSDIATAAVNATDPGTGQVVTNFNLTGLRPYLSDGVMYYVSVRAVAKNGLKSDFSQVATFSF